MSNIFIALYHKEMKLLLRFHHINKGFCGKIKFHLCRNLFLHSAVECADYILKLLCLRFVSFFFFMPTYRVDIYLVLVRAVDSAPACRRGFVKAKYRSSGREGYHFGRHSKWLLFFETILRPFRQTVSLLFLLFFLLFFFFL